MSRKWLGADTPFPERKAEEVGYELSRAYQSLFSDVLDYCRALSTIVALLLRTFAGLRATQQRVRHRGAIAILRSLLSSPDAAVMVLTNRAVKLTPSNSHLDAKKRVRVRLKLTKRFGRRSSICSAIRNYPTMRPPGRSNKPTASAPHNDRRRLRSFGDVQERSPDRKRIRS